MSAKKKVIFSTTYINSSVYSSAHRPIPRVGYLVINNGVFFDRRHFKISRYGRGYLHELVVAPERKVERVDQKNPAYGELVHFFRVQRRRLPVEIVAVLVL